MPEEKGVIWRDSHFAPQVGWFLCVGGVYVDIVIDVPSYPAEDAYLRASRAPQRKRGGNAANTSAVLAQLFVARKSVENTVAWMGATPGGNVEPTAFAMADLERFGVDTSLREVVFAAAGEEPLSQPTAYVIRSSATGSRTGVSWRGGLREVGVDHFERNLASRSWSWIHLECRLLPDTLHMARRARASGMAGYVLSVELEKPHLPQEEAYLTAKQADVVFLSKDWVAKNVLEGAVVEKESAQNREQVVSALKQIASQLHEGDAAHTSLLICGWGTAGAFALDIASGQHFYQPATLAPVVVDSVGAGDTFIGACIFALANGFKVQDVLRCGCAVAGGKVAQATFDDLARYLPSEMFAAGGDPCCEPERKVPRLA
mmetsp:Transcript_46720/g.111113  ORF Transcript_46720/g.111113 Transcript_46720/m.111113 type:complete len:374 (+) Transcript_46720:54-1175(+)